MEAVCRERTYVQCPNCGAGEARIDHLFDGAMPVSFGPWACDHCGRGYSGTIHSPKNINLEMSDKNAVRCWDVLVLPPQKAPLYLIVPAWDYRGDRDEIYYGKKYLYNENTCPINYMRGPVVIGRNTDPHGLFDYVGSTDMNDGDEPSPSHERIAEIMRYAGAKPADIPEPWEPGGCLTDSVD